jgi:hypothetical protein
MKVFTKEEDAKISYNTKQKYWLNSLCASDPNKLCGNWCALFYISDDNSGSRYVILGCKGTDKRLYIEKIND